MYHEKNKFKRGGKEKALRYLGLPLLLIPLLGVSCAGKFSAEVKKIPEVANLLPQDGDFQGWKRVGKMFSAASEKELYQFINGAAGLYIQHGFVSYAGQIYQGSESTELEVAIYNLGKAKKARELFQNPMLKPNLSRKLEGLGEEARVDERGLFHYALEFVKDRFFVRVVIQDKTQEGMNIALLFARYVAKGIP